MQKLCRMFRLKNLLQCYPYRSYCCYMRLQKTLDLVCRHKNTSTSKRMMNISSHAHCGTKEHLEDFSEPKKILWRLINEAYESFGNPNIKPTITAELIEQGENMNKMWQVTINMSWPEYFQVRGVASKKADAETISYLKACMKMKELGLLDENNKSKFRAKVMVYDDKILKVSKAELLNIYQRIWTRYGKKEYIPKFHTSKKEGIFGRDIYWKAQLNIMYPEEKVFEGYSGRLREAESIASARALEWLKEKQIINKKGRLILYSNEEQKKLIKLHSDPSSVCIPKVLQEKMTSVLENFKCQEEDCLTETSVNEDEIETKCDSGIYDVITEKIYQTPSEDEIIRRSREMFDRNISYFESNDPSIQEVIAVKMKLPIFQKRVDILRILDEHQIVVLSGETGCGKTTQVPQFILDYYIDKMKGATCNIVVTQPRRISAITMAEWVAYERGEKVGETVGYHVRLNKNLPKHKGAILYCSTGMLLRKLCSNSNLDGISHIIVDEVHERNIQIDFLLILLKRLLENNKNVKLLLMSASFNTNIFSQYFNNCPVIHVPGKIYPVKEFFLEDLKNDIPSSRTRDKTNPMLDADLIVNVIHYINESQGPGAILCFLPGWHDILTVQNKLMETCKDTSKWMVYVAHSRLPHEEQKKIFKSPPEDVRKVILATNIAETSITIDDVVFVVNTGLHKGTSFDGERGVASLGTQWITKANVRQRRGRAGRVQPGVCYNLFTRKVLMSMEDYPIPELLRMPLEKVILDCKLFCPETKAEEFLSMALQPPSRTALQAGMSELQISGVLDKNENLTSLGKVIVNFATHPRLSIALVYASFLGCLDPVLTICATLTVGKEPFLNTLEEKSVIKSIKQEYDNYLYSDHLALSKLFDTWKNLNEESDVNAFIEKNLLDEQTLNFIKELKALFAEDLSKFFLINDKTAFSDSLNKCNINSNHVPTILAALTAAFYPNVMKLLQGEVAHGRINKDVINYFLLKGQKGYIQKESVVSNEYELPSPWLIYFSALQSEARRLMMTSAVSSVPGICLLLFAGQNFTINEKSSIQGSEDSVDLMLDEYKKFLFTCTKEEADALLKWRNQLQKLFLSYVENLPNQAENNNETSSLTSNFLSVTKEILSTPQVPYTKGYSYRFVNNSLVSEEL